jgi:hypothetical protein
MPEEQRHLRVHRITYQIHTKRLGSVNAPPLTDPMAGGLRTAALVRLLLVVAVAWEKEGGEAILEDTHLEARGGLSVEVLAKRLAKDRQSGRVEATPIATAAKKVATVSYRESNYDPRTWKVATFLDANDPRKQVVRYNDPAKNTTSKEGYTWASKSQWQVYIRQLYRPEPDQVHLLPRINNVDIVYMNYGGDKLVAPVTIRRCSATADTPSMHFNFHAIRDSAVYFRREFIQTFPIDAYANGTWAEVTHCGGSKFETLGVWHYGFRGSGLFLNVGKTIAFENHQDASIYFLGEWPLKLSSGTAEIYKPLPLSLTLLLASLLTLKHAM